MIEVYICEDEEKQLKTIADYVEKYIMIENLDAKLVAAERKPNRLLENIDNDHQRLYFLDIDLGADIDGMELARRIRVIDVNSKIVFITTHAELALQTLKYEVEPLDFILKDDPKGLQRNIIDAIELAQRRFNQTIKTRTEYLSFKDGDQIRSVRVDDILFFESADAPHKVIVNLENAHFEIYSSVKGLTKLNTAFFRCHKSFVVNYYNIKMINGKKRTVTMHNGQNIPCSIMGYRKLVEILEKI